MQQEHRQGRAAGRATTQPPAVPPSSGTGERSWAVTTAVSAWPENGTHGIMGEPGPLFPPLPTLLATRLQMELLLAEQTVDLRAAAGILLNDMGATLEIFRRAGEECGGGPDAPERLEDCLASLGTGVWMEVICAHAVERAATHEGSLMKLTSFWEHGRLLAYASWLVAETMDSICPEEAFLVGLLHEAGRLPMLLGWDCSEATATQLAEHWHLPHYLRSVIPGLPLSSRWHEVLDLAHAWSHGEDCLLMHTA